MDASQEMSRVKRFLRQKVRTDIVAEYDEMIDELPDEITSFAEAEQHLRKGTIKIAGKLLQCWVEVAERELAVPCCPTCQKKMRHRGLRECTITTTIGDVKFKRPRYICPACGKTLYPHDATAKFLAHGVSQSLAQVIARMGADRPFDRAVEDLEEDYYLHMSKQTVRDVTEDAGATILQAETSHCDSVWERPPKDRANALACTHDHSCDIGVVTCDGTSIHLREIPEYLGPRSGKAVDWREIRVGNVTVGDIPKDANPPEKERGYDFHLDVKRTETFARFASPEDIGRHLYIVAVMNGYLLTRLRCFISDGAGWLRTIAEELFPDAILILDWFHAMEYVGDLASELFGSGNAEAKRWIAARETELWNGRPGDVLREMKSLRGRESLTNKQRELLEKTITYFMNNRDRMDYPRYRELGLPIGSGRVEGLCKTLVGSRCKDSGMRRWTVRGSQGVLRIRAARRDGHYKDLWRKHFTAG
jgi:hypothetical protein